MSKIFRAADVLSGQEAKATMQTGTEIFELFYAKNIEAILNKRKTPVRALGTRGEQQKTAGWNGTGTMTLYYVQSLFRQQALLYHTTGVDLYFNLIIENEDPTSAAGKQTIVLIDCNFDSIVLAKFNTEEDKLEEDAPFTFSDFLIVDSFKTL